jgi:hypothetical protein
LDVIAHAIYAANAAIVMVDTVTVEDVTAIAIAITIAIAVVMVSYLNLSIQLIYGLFKIYPKSDMEEALNDFKEEVHPKKEL